MERDKRIPDGFAPCTDSVAPRNRCSIKFSPNLGNIGRLTMMAPRELLQNRHLLSRTPDERMPSMPRLPSRIFILTPLSAFCVARRDCVPPTFLKGRWKQYTFEQSKIFPGTFRDYWIYVPKQYDPAKPACVYVNQDGIQYKAPESLR